MLSIESFLLVLAALIGLPLVWLRNNCPGLRAFCYSTMLIFVLISAFLMGIDEVQRRHQSMMSVTVMLLLLAYKFVPEIYIHFRRIWKKRWLSRS